MPQNCPHIIKIDHLSHQDRYGNSLQRVIVWSTIPVDPHAKGYNPADAQQVLETARQHKSSHPDAEVYIKNSAELTTQPV